MSARFRENEIYIYSSVTTGNYSGIQSIKAACPDIPDPEAALAAAPASVADAVTGRVKCGAAVKADTEPDISTIGDSAEALINAGKNADPTTFLHELHHAIMLMGDNMKEFRDVYMKVKDTKEFRSFLKKNMDILKYVLGKKDEDGKFVRDSKGNYILDETILDSLLKSDTKWTTADFEFEARLYEAYIRNGQTFNPSLTGFFRRMAETFRQIYNALRNGIFSVTLNDEIVEYYDKLYGYDKTTGQTSKLSGSGELSHLDDRIDNGTGEKTDTLKQDNGTEPSVEEVQARLEKLSPIGAMAVEDVDESFKRTRDKTAEVIRKRRDWAKSVTPMGMVDSPIGKVLISNNSIDDSVAPSHGANKYTASLYSSLDKLITNSVYATTTIRKGEERAILISKFKRPSGEIGYVGIVVRKSRNNNLYYFHSVIKNEGGPGVATNSSGPETAPSVNNLLSKYTLVKNSVPTILKQDDISSLSASDQYEAVKAQYYGTDKYMIAPNGRASNLTERQWIQVRTQNFLEWGGDWINDPEHASVILDENGEPKQLYHGSPSTGIEVFSNRERSINGGEKGFTYLTDNEKVAENFSREFEEGSSAFRVRLTGRAGEIYSLYAKMSNPLDFRNLTEQNKNDIAETYVDDVFGADSEDRNYQIELTKNSMENALKYENYQLVKGYAESYLGNLSSYGYDGIIAPMGTSGELRESLEYAVPSPNQVKSVNNSGEFSLESDSILYQIVNHGTGSYFDKFDMEFISSGAGSQAFGLGFYFTDDEKIAESYANLTYTEESKSSDINYYKGILERAEKALKEGRKQYELDENNQEELREDARRRINEKYEWIKKDGGKLPKILEYKYPGMTIDEWREKALSEVDTITYHTVNIKSLEENVENAKRHLSTIEQKETGTPYIYKVDIPDRGFLQWDKVIPQSLIRKIVNNRINEDSSLDFNDMMMDFSYLETGADLYNYLYGQDPLHEIEAVRELQKAGIKGIKYRAGQNVSLPNGANPKAYNYVVFNPSDAQIVEQRNLTTGQSILKQEGESNPYKPESFDIEINDIFKNRGNSQYNEIVLSKASDVYKEIGLEGEEFRVKRGSITRHRTKDYTKTVN